MKLVGIQENGLGVVSTGDGNADEGFNDTQEYQVLVATGVMENIESIVSVTSEDDDLAAASEGIISELVQVILRNEVDDFYEEAFSLTCSLTCRKISPVMWGLFEWIYQAYNKDACDYFSAMAPTLHNYIEADPQGFLENPERLKMLNTMCINVRIATPFVYQYRVIYID